MLTAAVYFIALLLSSVNLPGADAANCFQRTYPKLLGSELDVAASAISSMDIDSAGAFLYVGGTSSDTNIVAAADRPIVGQFHTATETWNWRREYSTSFGAGAVTFSFVSSLRLSPNKS